VEVDKSGRICVPEYLRQYAGLSKDIVIAGVYDRLELWDEPTWRAYAQRTEGDSGQIAERLGSMI
jgi:MraZ protein